MESITSPRDLLRLLRRRLRLFLLTAALAAMAILLASQMLTLQYTGTTEFERRVDAAAEEVMKSKSQSFAAWKLTLEKELTSEARIADVLVRLKRLEPHDGSVPLPKEQSIARQSMLRRVSANLRIDWRVGNEEVDRVALSYTDSDPDLAWQVPQGLVEEYGTYVSKQIKDHLTASCNYYVERIRDAEQTLKRVRAERVAFLATNGDKYPEPGAYAQRVNQLVIESQNLRPQLDLAHQREAQLQMLLKEPATTQPTSQPARDIAGPNPEYARLDEELRRAKQDLSDAINVRGMKEKHPIVVALRKKVDELDAQLKKTPKIDTVQQVIDQPPAFSMMQLEFDLAATRSLIQQLTARVEKVQGELDSLQKNVAVYTRAAQEYTDKVKEEADWQDKIKYFQQRHNDLQLQLQAEMSQRLTSHDVLRYATRPYEPSSPKLWMIMAGALMGAVAVAAGLVLLLGFFDRTVSQPQTAMLQFDVPVHGVIGEIVTQREHRSRRARMLIITPLVTLLLLAGLLLAGWLASTRINDNETYRKFLNSPLQVMKEQVTGERSPAVVQRD